MKTLSTPLKTRNPITIGILSDTHGRVPPAVGAAFTDVDVIIHAGDVDDPAVLAQLKRIAPVIGVRGNMDSAASLAALPVAVLVTLGGKTFYILHNVNLLDLLPEAADIHVVVSGHTHAPDIHRKNGVLYLNPGSAAFPRRGSPAGGLRVRIDGDLITTETVIFAGNGNRP